MTENLPNILWTMLAMTLVISALVSRRVPMRGLILGLMVWAAILFGVYFVFLAFQPRLFAWQQSQRAGDVIIAPTPVAKPIVGQTRTVGGALSIPLSEDGHYWVDADVNGSKVHFLIDSGASITAVSQSTADALALPPDPMNASVMMGTANGTIKAQRSVIAAMDIGGIQASDLPVVVSSAFGTTNVLGMNFLGKLKSWRVENGTMVLEAE